MNRESGAMNNGISWRLPVLILAVLLISGNTLIAQQTETTPKKSEKAAAADGAETQEATVARLHKTAMTVATALQKELESGTFRQDVIKKVQKFEPLMKAQKYDEAEELLNGLLSDLGVDSKKPAASPAKPSKATPKRDLSTAKLPDERSFRLGFTPHDLMKTLETSEGVQKTLSRHADLVAVHIDSGIPWEEALNETEFPAPVQEHLAKIEKVIERLTGKPSIYLALTPIVLTRNNIAKYWGDDEELAKKWNDRNFDDPDVILAYTRYCQRMIRRFQPKYFAYGIEANMLAGANPEKFKQFPVLARQVYETLKKENPELPIFLTFQADLYHKIPAIQGEVIRQLLPWSDYIAVSSYPYMEGHTAADLPENWFSDVAELDPDKPFAIAETGFLADGKFKCRNGMTVQGGEQVQADYVQVILQDTRRLHGEFVVWFFAEDIDKFYESLANPQMKEFVGMWKDAGLVDETGREREGLKAWDRWLHLPVTSTGR